ncbi:hypothetical protein SDC9_129918 [bioreactor metagenome]|uniref:Uncharacterized protein n=1 Tax=bioreactor metagenome TaxID=1076179 RepID=A0A645D0B6_9ZZZZ
MKLNGFSFDKLRLESLDTQTVKGRGTVQEDRVSFHHVLQDIVNHRFFSVNDLLGRFYRFYNTPFNEFTDDERFIKFSGHIFWNAAFVHFKLGADNDNRTGGVIHTLTEQVLAETSLLPFQAVGKRFQRTVRVGFNSARFA